MGVGTPPPILCACLRGGEVCLPPGHACGGWCLDAWCPLLQAAACLFMCLSDRSGSVVSCHTRCPTSGGCGVVTALHAAPVKKGAHIAPIGWRQWMLACFSPRVCLSRWPVLCRPHSIKWATNMATPGGPCVVWGTRESKTCRVCACACACRQCCVEHRVVPRIVL